MSDMQAEPAEPVSEVATDVVMDKTDDGQKTATVVSVTNLETKEELFEATVVDNATSVGVTMTGATPDEALSGAISELAVALTDQVPVVDRIETIKFVGPEAP